MPIIESMERPLEKRRLGRTDLTIAPLVLGGNVFGWTADEKTSFDLLDRFAAAGLNAVDTADVLFATGRRATRAANPRPIIGKWMKSRGNRDKIVVVTKVGSDMGEGEKDLSAAYIERRSRHRSSGCRPMSSTSICRTGRTVRCPMTRRSAPTRS